MEAVKTKIRLDTIRSPDGLFVKVDDMVEMMIKIKKLNPDATILDYVVDLLYNLKSRPQIKEQE